MHHLLYSQAFSLSSLVDLVAIVRKGMKAIATAVPVDVDEFGD
jgi:hypothetical protein